MAGELISNDYEVEFNGVLAGEGSDYGIEVAKVEWFKSPSVRATHADRGQDHGAFESASYYSGFSWTANFEVWAPDGNEDTFAANVAQAMKFSTLTQYEVPFVIQLPGFGKMRRNCKVMNRSDLNIDMDYLLGKVANFSVQYYASNPRALSDTEHSQALTLSVEAGGYSYDISYDIVYGSAGSLYTPITNSGIFETRPRIRVVGPLTAFNLENLTTGKNLAFANVSLSSSEYVDIDFLSRSVMLNGTTSRYNWVVDSTQWWQLEPGVNNIRFNGSTTVAPTATIYWRDAWV